MMVYECRQCGMPSTSVELCSDCIADQRADYNEGEA